jgi:hypothetical protein
MNIISVQCLQRWQKVLKPGLVKGSWSDKEDQLLRSIVARGPKNWGKVASCIPGRTSKQCRERWSQHLDPILLRCDFCAEEDNIILATHAKVGNKWAAIARALPGRTENTVKIRFRALERVIASSDRRSFGTLCSIYPTLGSPNVTSQDQRSGLQDDAKLFCEALSLVSKSPTVHQEALF